ncbi:iron chelate uptake ABC transporter family permease subunit [Planosporangium flavigriseum]
MRARDVGSQAAGRHRRALTVALLLAVLAGTAVGSVAIGAKAVAFGDVLRALAGADDGDTLVVSSLRLPRTALGLLVGVALGVGGALAQEITRNPLADPGLLGIGAGAAVAVAAGIGLLGLTSPYQYVWLAFAGAAAAAAVVYALGATGRGGAGPVKLALAGAAVTALLDSLTNLLVLLDIRTLDQYRSWAVGSLAGRDPGLAGDLAPFVLAGLLLALALAPRLNSIALGDDLAASLGTDVRRTRLAGALAVTVLTGAAVAAAGPVVFVGLVVPHLVRMVTGPDVRWLLPCSGLAGAALMLGADTLGRVVAPPGELEAGVVTALLGGPFLVAMVKRGNFREQR